MASCRLGNEPVGTCPRLVALVGGDYRLLERPFDVRQPPVIAIFRSVRELTDAIGAFIDAYNDRCQPFTWTKNADQLLAKIKPSKN